MTKQRPDPLDQQILACIPRGGGVTYGYIIDSVRTEKSPNGVRYHVDRLVRQGHLNSERFLGRVIFYRPDCRTTERQNTAGAAD